MLSRSLANTKPKRLFKDQKPSNSASLSNKSIEKRSTKKYEKHSTSKKPSQTAPQPIKKQGQRLQDSTKSQELPELSQKNLQQTDTPPTPPHAQPHQVQQSVHDEQESTQEIAAGQYKAWKGLIQTFAERNALTFLDPQLLEEAISHHFIVPPPSALVPPARALPCSDRLVFYGLALAELQLTEYYMGVLPRGAQLATRVSIS